MIAATDRGFLFVFSGRVDNRINTEYSLAGEQIESKHIIKVAHEVQCCIMISINEAKVIQHYLIISNILINFRFKKNMFPNMFRSALQHWPVMKKEIL